MRDPTFVLVRVPAHIERALRRLAQQSGRSTDDYAAILIQRAVLTELIAEKMFERVEQGLERAAIAAAESKT